MVTSFSRFKIFEFLRKSNFAISQIDSFPETFVGTNFREIDQNSKLTKFAKFNCCEFNSLKVVLVCTYFIITINAFYFLFIFYFLFQLKLFFEVRGILPGLY